MGLLSASSTEDPCSLLNSGTTGYPDLWISTSANVSQIASAGVLKTFLSLLPSTKTASILTNADATSTYRLKKYLSTDGTSLDSILLKKSSVVVGIIDTYVVTNLNITGYTYSTSDNIKIEDNKIWNSSDQTSEGTVSANPSSLLGLLLRDGFLLRQSEIYSTTTGQNRTLLDLYTKKQNDGLTTAEQISLTQMENRNLRFFSAFLAEYCFYKTRYSWLLNKYFTIYKISPTDYTATTSRDKITATSPEFTALFNPTRGSGENQASSQEGDATISQADYLKCLGYHLACLSTRMKDMRRLLEAINTYYNTTLTQIQEKINSTDARGSNQQLSSALSSFRTNQEENNKYMTEADFRKSAMEYTKQKGEYANVLLGLYAFLNVSALAMIFHIARS